MYSCVRRVFSFLLILIYLTSNLSQLTIFADGSSGKELEDPSSSESESKNDEGTVSDSEIEGIIDISATVPVEPAPKSSSINLLQGLSEGKPFHNIIDYIGYKNITQKDMTAVEWSFILSQMATPLEESLEDVLQHDLILQMKEKDLEISSAPDVTDKDYAYDQINSDFKVDKVQFADVYNTISSNIRYSKVWDATGNQYTVKTFYDSPRRKANIGYISDYVYTNIANSTYDNMTSLPDKLETLYTYDNETQASALVDYWKHPEKLMMDSGKTSLTGQRRFIPIFVGSNVTDYYLQLGIMMFCKSHVDDGMTFEKFVDLYGSCEIWADSFGNLVIYDSSAQKYRMVLPNACNPIFTSDGDSESYDMFDTAYRQAIAKVLEDEQSDADSISSVSDVMRDIFNLKTKLGYTTQETDWVGAEPWIPEATQIGFNKQFKGWSEKTFIYNKWIGAMYSTKRRTSLDAVDPVTYEPDKQEDLDRGYYPAYLGPLEDSRIDYRNSTVIAKPSRTYLHPQLTSFNNIKDYSSVIGKFGQDILNFITGATQKTLVVSEYPGQDPTIYNENSGLRLADKYLPFSTVLYNTILAEGAKASWNTDAPLTNSDLYIMWNMAQHTYAMLIQTAHDTVMTTTSDMDLLGPDKGGGVAQYVPDNALVDVADSSLLGEDGGFLEDTKHVLHTDEKEMEVTDEAGNTATENVAIQDRDYSATFYPKRDNRISNRFVEYPSDDIAVLSYVWLNDYIPKLIYNTYYEDGAGYNSVKSFLSSNGASDSHKDEYVLLPFNIDSNGNYTYKLTTCTLPLQNATEARDFYSTLYQQDKEYEGDYSPCTNHTVVNAYALLMGLYKNTDTQYNVNNSVEVADVSKDVIIADLASKVSYGVDNQVEIIMNNISGFAQYVHNALGVGTSTVYTVGMNSTTFEQVLYTYLVLMLLVLLIVIVVNMFRILFRRESLFGGARTTAIVLSMLVVVPITFVYSQKFNKSVMSNIYRPIVDRATLISVQKSIDGMMNTEALAERRWKAFRQQFANLEDVYADSYILVPKSVSDSGAQYKKMDIDAAVRSVKYLGSGADGSEYSDNKWYTVPTTADMYPLYSRYSGDFTKYFYDNLVEQYMMYYKDKLETDQGTVISQYTSVPTGNSAETTEVLDRLDRIMHSLKGGYGVMMTDTSYLQENDVFGVSRFFNSVAVNPYGADKDPDDIQDVSINMRKFAPLLDVSMRKQKATQPANANSSKVYLPYTPEGLKALTLGERSEFTHYIPLDAAWKQAPTPFEMELLRVNENITKRAKDVATFRAGEFTDTALMYTTSVIVADELARNLTDLRYGPPDVTDTDKILRLIYAQKTDDIYNSEALMYIIQDGVKGGAVLAWIVVLCELMLALVNIMSIGVCAFVAITMPIFIMVFFDRRSPLYVQQFIGVTGQLVVNLLSLYVANMPFIIGVKLSKTAMGDLSLWLFTLILLIFEMTSMFISTRMFKYLIKDYATAGGSYIMDKLMNLKQNIAGSDVRIDNPYSDTVMLSAGNTIADITNPEMTIHDIQDIELKAEERQGQNPYDDSEMDALVTKEEDASQGSRMLSSQEERIDLNNLKQNQLK